MKLCHWILWEWIATTNYIMLWAPRVAQQSILEAFRIVVVGKTWLIIQAILWFLGSMGHQSWAWILRLSWNFLLFFWGRGRGGGGFSDHLHLFIWWVYVCWLHDAQWRMPFYKFVYPCLKLTIGCNIYIYDFWKVELSYKGSSYSRCVGVDIGGYVAIEAKLIMNRQTMLSPCCVLYTLHFKFWF